MKKTNYTAQIRCYNCGYVGELAIKKGQKVDTQKCPKCECKELGLNSDY